MRLQRMAGSSCTTSKHLDMLAYTMTNLPNTWPHRLTHSLPVRIILVVLTTALVAGICPLIFFINRSVSPTVLRIAVVILVGLAGGLSASVLLTSNPGPIKYTAAWFSMAIGLMILHFLTKGYAGIEILPVAPLNLGRSTYGQLTLGTIAAGLATLAWKPIPAVQVSPTSAKRQPKTKISKPRPQQKQEIIRKTNNHPQISKKSRQITSRIDWKKIGGQWEKQLKALKIKTNVSLSKSNAKVSKWLTYLSSKSYSAMKVRRPAIRMQSSKRQHRAFARKKSAVRLVGKIENRCPYCLEIVKPDDPRGIKICPECNTYHHADCWAVTGNCQVPHYHE